MENKTAAILVVAMAVAALIAAGGVYAMVGRQAAVTGNAYPGTAYGSGVGPSMMGWSTGYAGGMMGGYAGGPGGMMGGRGMMGDWNGTGSMYEYMQQYMQQYWNSTTVP